MSVNKHTALKEWAQAFTTDILGFESVEMYPGMKSIVPNYGDYLIKQDICGNKYKEYTFAFVGVESLSTGTDDLNELNMQIFDDFNTWIEAQEIAKNYPNFGDNVTDYRLVPLQNMANQAFYDESTKCAKYMLMVRLEYVEKGV